jgi:hypothetical protein
MVMKTKLLLVIVLCGVVALAQDSGDFSPDASAVTKAMAACGPEKVTFSVTNRESSQPLPTVEPRKALVYVIEEMPATCGINCGVTTKIGLDGAWIGANQGDSYFAFAVTPGEHHLCVRWQSIMPHRNRLAALMNFTAEAGKTYYFRNVVFETDALGTHLDLAPINSDQGQLLVALFPLSMPRVNAKLSRHGSGASRIQPRSGSDVVP